MSATVPPEYVGLWRRTRITRASGKSDATTQVWWFQSPRFHIDLRIPAGRPAVASAAALGQLAASPFAAYAAQLAFAGETIVGGARCEWHPEIGFPFLCTDVDAGSMRFDAPDRLHEAGLDGSYEEDWERIEAGPMRGLRLESGSAVAFLVIGQHWLALAHGAPDAAFPAMAANGQPEWSEFCVAERAPDQSWRIVACNNPWREGGALALDGQLGRGAMVMLPTPFAQHWTVTDTA
ncbi:MAG: hypothetical protein V4508_24430 [Pseudomonadota bacterium]